MYPKNIGKIITPSKTNRYVAETVDPRIEWQDELKKRMAYLRLGKRFSRGIHQYLFSTYRKHASNAK